MKTLLVSIFMFATLLTLAARTSSAQSARTFAVSSPFEFMIGDRSFPAGQYTVEAVSANTLRLRDKTGNILIALIASPLSSQKPRGRAGMVFNQYGKAYVLRQIWRPESDLGYSLPESAQERELARNHSKSPEPPTIAQKSE